MSPARLAFAAASLALVPAVAAAQVPPPLMAAPPPVASLYPTGIPTQAFEPVRPAAVVDPAIRGNRIGFAGPRGVAVPFQYGGVGGYGLSGLYPVPYTFGTSYYGYPYAADALYAPYAFPFADPIGPTDAPAPPLLTAGSGPITNVRLTGSPASVALEFPAAAKVWLGGKEVDGDAATSKTVTSPDLPPGQRYTFDLRAEWTGADGKTYGYDRTVTLGSGERSKVTVMAGTPVAGGKKAEPLAAPTPVPATEDK